MKLNLLRVFILCFFVLSLVSCDKNEEEEKDVVHKFELNSAEWEVFLDREAYFSITSGNSDYTIEVEDPTLVSVSFEYGISAREFGGFGVKAHKKGETTVSITDNVTEKTVEVRVKVTDGYVSAIVERSNHPVLTEGQIIYFIHNENKDIYLFDSDQAYRPEGLTLKGNYEFVVEDKVPYMKLLYVSDSEGEDTTPLEPVWHTFNIADSDKQVFNILASYLQIEWEKLAEPRLGMPAPDTYRMRMREEGTDYTAIVEFNYYMTIPGGILD